MKGIVLKESKGYFKISLVVFMLTFLCLNKANSQTESKIRLVVTEIKKGYIFKLDTIIKPASALNQTLNQLGFDERSILKSKAQGEGYSITIETEEIRN